MENTNIGWCDHSWNPVTGCSEVSPGCDGCYAKVIAERLRGQKAFPQGFDVTLRERHLRDPVKWRNPSRIFLSSMSDIFHIEVPDDYLRQIWDVMLEADHHIYMVLTKRAHRMAHKIKTLRLKTPEHIWLGVSAENQELADSRIPALLSIHSEGRRWVSAEPLLERITLRHYLPGEIAAGTTYRDSSRVVRYDLDGSPLNPLDWVICGGESGPERRTMDKEWAQDLLRECQAAGVPYYFKQGNAFRSGRDRLLEGQEYNEWPEPDGWASRRAA